MLNILFNPTIKVIHNFCIMNKVINTSIRWCAYSIISYASLIALGGAAGFIYGSQRSLYNEKNKIQFPFEFSEMSIWCTMFGVIIAANIPFVIADRLLGRK